MTVKNPTDPPEGAAAGAAGTPAPAPPPAGAPAPGAAPAAAPGAGAAPAGAATVQVDPADAANGVTAGADGATVVVPSAAFAKIKSAAEAKGRKAAEAKLLAPLFEHGFTSIDEVIALANAAQAQAAGGTVPPQGDPMSVPNPAGGAPAGSPAGAPGAGAPAGQPAGAPAAGAVPGAQPGQPPAGAAPAPGQPNPNERKYTPEVRAALQRQRDESTRQIQAAQAEVARIKAEAEQYKTQLTQTQSEAQIGYKLAAAGCADVEYALHKLRKHRESLKPEELAAFDQPGAPGADGKPAASPMETWLGGLKTQSPHLFGAAGAAPVQSSPAQTGTPSQPPPPPGPGQAASLAGDGARVDYRSLTPDKKREYDRANGLA